jgi:hypothetical protein
VPLFSGERHIRGGQFVSIGDRVVGSDEERSARTMRDPDARLTIFTNLRLEALDRLAVQRQLDAIGDMRREAELT